MKSLGEIKQLQKLEVEFDEQKGQSEQYLEESKAQLPNLRNQ